MKRAITFILAAILLMAGHSFAQTCTVNLLVNPSFEECIGGLSPCLNNWNPTGSVGVVTDAHDGTTAAQACEQSASVSQAYPAVPGQAFTASAWAKGTLSNSSFAPVVWLRFLQANYVPIGDYTTAPFGSFKSILTNQYELYEVAATAPANAAYVHLLVFKEDGGCVTVDDLQLCFGAGAGSNLPELFPLDYEVTANALNPNGSTQVNTDFTLKNTGTGSITNDFNIVWRISTDQSPSFDDYVLRDETYTFDLLPSQAISIQRADVVPANTPNLPPGQYNLILCLDDGGTVAEVSEGNNCQVRLINIFGNASCSLSAQLIDVTCHNNLTLIDASDDQFFFFMNVSGTGTGAIWTSDNLYNGTYSAGYNQQLLQGPLPISGGTKTFTITDANNPACQTSLTVVPPPTCSPQLATDCGFTPQIISNTCNDAGTPNDPTDDLFYIQYSVNVNTAAPWYLLEGNQWGTDNTPQTIGPFAISDGTVGLHFHDFYEPGCEVSLSVQAPATCSGGGGGGQIDLSLSLLQPNSAPIIYNNYTTTATITNTGTQTATGVKVKFAKPSGVVYTGGNEFIASQGTFNPFGNEEWNVGNIPPSGSAALTVSYFLLQNIAPDAYAQVIAANEQDSDSTPNNGTPPNPNEDDEANTSSSPPVLLADLTLSNVNVTTTAVVPGEIANYSLNLNNIGNTTASGDFVIGAYLSSDNILDGGDVLVGVINTGNTPVGSIPNVPGSITVPPNTVSGIYFLIFKADINNSIAESNESNNTDLSLLQIAPPSGDCAGNLMPNPGFEGGLGAWTGSGPHEISADAHSGSKALRLFGNAAHAYRINLPVEPGATYEMRFWGKCVGTGTCAVWSALPNGSGNAKTITTNLYDEYFLTFTANPNAGSSQSLEVVLSKSAGNFSVFLDDICLTKVPSACQGDLILETQAEVNAAFTCPVIEGDLIIRSPFGPSGASSDITDLSPLSGIGQVNGFIVIENNDLLTDLDDLHIGYAKGLAVVFNDGLTFMNGVSSLQGEMDNISILQNTSLLIANMNQVTKLNNGLNITGNTALQRLDYFLSLQSVGNLVHIGGSPALTDVLGLSNLATVGDGFIIENCTSLGSLLGLENLQSVGNLAITQNDVLSDVSALGNLSTVQNSLFLTDNPVLEDCCVFKNLLTNGGIGGSVTIEDNAGFCNSAQDILGNCGGTGDPCDAISINPGTGQITISGATAAHKIIKVFRPNWTLAFECLDGACNSMQVVNGLNAGSHFVEIKLFNAAWELICTKSQTVNVNGGGANLLIPDDRHRLAFDKFYPSPVSHWLSMVMFSPKEQSVTLDFYDQQGRLARTEEVLLEEGRNVLEFAVSGWKSGTYNVIARGEGLPAYGRFLKVWEE